MNHALNFALTLSCVILYFVSVYIYWFKKKGNNVGDSLFATWMTFVCTLCAVGFICVLWGITK